MKKKHINIFTNGTDLSLETQTILAKNSLTEDIR